MELTSSAIEIEMDVFDFSELGELVVDVVLLGLLVDPGHEEDPTLDRTLGTRFAGVLAGISLKNIYFLKALININFVDNIYYLLTFKHEFKNV